MKLAIQEYTEALLDHIECVKAEVVAKDRRRKAHYRLLKAKEEMQAKEAEVLGDIEAGNNNNKK